MSHPIETDELVASLAANIKNLATFLGTHEEEVQRMLTELRDYRCWKRIPRCFNGWGVGLCALHGGHDGDCNPIPRRGA